MVKRGAIMSQTYKYPNFVDKANIIIRDGSIQNTSYRWRSSLIIPFTKEEIGEKKIITFIMKNPSLADTHFCDKTVSNVIHYVKRLTEIDVRFSDINEIRIINLFSIYSTDSTYLKEIISEIDNFEELKNENNETIKRLLKDTHFLVPAWGKKPSNLIGNDNLYRDRAIEILDIISNSTKNYKLFLIKHDKKRTLYPLHPERIGYKGEKINNFLLHPYTIKGNLFVPM